MSVRPLRLAVVSPFGELGGAELYLLRLLDATDRLEPHALLLRDGPLRAELETRGVPVEVLSVGRRGRDLARRAARRRGLAAADRARRGPRQRREGRRRGRPGGVGDRCAARLGQARPQLRRAPHARCWRARRPRRGHGRGGRPCRPAPGRHGAAAADARHAAAPGAPRPGTRWPSLRGSGPAARWPCSPGCRPTRASTSRSPPWGWPRRRTGDWWCSARTTPPPRRSVGGCSPWPRSTVSPSGSGSSASCPRPRACCRRWTRWPC